jgi:hypothetical protein
MHLHGAYSAPCLRCLHWRGALLQQVVLSPRVYLSQGIDQASGGEPPWRALARTIRELATAQTVAIVSSMERGLAAGADGGADSQPGIWMLEGSLVAAFRAEMVGVHGFSCEAIYEPSGHGQLNDRAARTQDWLLLFKLASPSPGSLSAVSSEEPQAGASAD